MPIDSLVEPYLHSHTFFNSKLELFEALKSGVLDRESLVHHLQKHDHFAEVIVHGPDGKLKAARLSGNLRTNAGGTWQASAMGGSSVSGHAPVGFAGVASATGLTSLTSSGMTNNAYIGQYVSVGPNASGTGSQVVGVITQQTSTTGLTVDRWYTPSTLSGAAAATPNATGFFNILPGQAPMQYLAIGTNASPNTTDTAMTTEINLNTNFSAVATARILTTWTETVTPSASGSSTNTFTYTATTGTLTCTTGTGALTCVSLWNSIVANGGIMGLEAAISSVTLSIGDTLAVTWTVTG